MWTLAGSPTAAGRQRLSLSTRESLREALEDLAQPVSVLAQALQARIATCPFEALCLELPPLRAGTLDLPFEAMLVASPALAGTRADPSDFDEAFRAAGDASAARFGNLGGDAILVAPRPPAPGAGATFDGGHLAAFARTAEPAAFAAVFRLAAEHLIAAIPAGRPLWLSTAGLGVPWLHLRLDTRPKYYRHRPYADENWRPAPG